MQTQRLLSSNIASISDLKRNPMLILENGDDEAVAILNRNKPVFYCISPRLLEYYQELELEVRLNKTADERLCDLEPIEVSLNEL
ncbi:type II toxin-antitoxin system Phd/YefM family antitoxin [Pasteurella atlantica]|uniref:type II toxin-antitoxin system Phd/YefM family antitoxin n=1 Tax=Pasteurellaceae TaxID=712 RepID=UPI00274B1C99|nr:stability protein StbD [Pasteurella atlantica]MDP8098432.1 stability protein StbD [Pasteurella atlantica]MDP8106454.1 stability protein StbD [Pasteurella atlantica]MDP8116235.1 stability protein StbD [Pasteurella atlantica]